MPRNCSKSCAGRDVNSLRKKKKNNDNSKKQKNGDRYQSPDKTIKKAKAYKYKNYTDLTASHEDVFLATEQ